MNQPQIELIESRVLDFADHHIESVPEDDRIPMILKRAHTIRVAADAEAIALDLGWHENDVMLAKAIALLHDIARFPQYCEYKTFSDPRSFDHGEKAYQICSGLPVLKNIESQDLKTLLNAVRYHNRKDIPAGITGNDLNHLNLIRDADKLDILSSISRIVEEGWHKKYPGVLLNIDVDGPLTDSLVAQILESNKGDYQHVNTLADINLMRIAWIYSINYKPALVRIVQRNLFESTASLLPDTPQVREIRDRASLFIREKLAR